MLRAPLIGISCRKCNVAIVVLRAGALRVVASWVYRWTSRFCSGAISTGGNLSSVPSKRTYRPGRCTDGLRSAPLRQRNFVKVRR